MVFIAQGDWEIHTHIYMPFYKVGQLMHVC